jgi:hypothetical protein
MVLTLLGGAAGVAACALSIVILVHAFRRSVGTGLLVLCVPAYVLVYAFSQFEHPRKNAVVMGWLCSLVLAAVLLALTPLPSGL